LRRLNKFPFISRREPIKPRFAIPEPAPLLRRGGFITRPSALGEFFRGASPALPAGRRRIGLALGLIAAAGALRCLGTLLLRSGAIMFALVRGRVDRAGPTRPRRAQLVALPRRAAPLAAALVLGQCGPSQEHHPSQGQRPDAGKAPSILHEIPFHLEVFPTREH